MMKDNLEKAFHDALINQEVNYDPKAWESLKKKLPKSKTPWYLGGAAASVAVVAGLFWFTSTEELDSKPQQKEIANIEQALQNDYNSNTPTNSTEDNSQPSNQNKVSVEPIIQRQNSNPNKPNIASVTENENAISPITPKKPQTSVPTLPVDHENSISANLWQSELSKIEIQGKQNIYCENAQVNLKAVKVPDNTKIIWKLSNGKTIHGNAVQFKAELGMSVEISYEPKEEFSSSINTINESRFNLNVVEASKPSIDVNSKEQNTKNFVTLSNNNRNIEHLVWRFENKTTKGSSCSAYVTTKGSHEYTVESYDKNGCFTTSKGQVEMNEDYNLYAMSVFTPNGDGKNEVFMPEALKVRDVSFKLTIFDRNGRLIYTTTDAFSPWDGTYNGQAIENGTYVWMVSLINEEGLPEQYKSVVNLER